MHIDLYAQRQLVRISKKETTFCETKKPYSIFCEVIVLARAKADCGCWYLVTNRLSTKRSFDHHGKKWKNLNARRDFVSKNCHRMKALSTAHARMPVWRLQTWSRLRWATAFVTLGDGNRHISVNLWVLAMKLGMGIVHMSKKIQVLLDEETPSGMSQKAKHNLMRSSYGVQTTEKMGDSRQAKQLWCYYLLIRQQTEPQLIFLKDICVEKNWSDRRPLFAIRQKLILRQDNCLQNVVREKYWGSVSSSITLVSKNI